MKKIETLLLARWVLPIEPEFTVLENYALALDKGKIEGILPIAEAKIAYFAKEIIQLDHHIIMPGLINAHVHTPMVLLRGFGDDLPLMNWLNEVIWPAERQYLDEAFVKSGAMLAMAEMICSGTTCFNDHYFFPEIISNVAEAVGMRAKIGATLIEINNPWSKNLDEALAKTIDLFERYKNNPLLGISFAPHASYTLSNEGLIKIKTALQKYPLPLHIHMHETKSEIEQDQVNYQKRPLQRFYDSGLLSKRCQLVHMTQVTEEDIKILKETSSSVVHCPSSNLKLASGLCSVQSLLNAGINVSLGTDGAASNNTLDLFQAIYLAALIGKLEKEDPTAVCAMSALKMATINGAKALGMDDSVGSLVVGKSADIIALDMDCLNAKPLYHPISQIVYATNSRQVSDVWVNGKCLFRKGQFTQLNKVDLLNEAHFWEEKIRIKN